jgi:hypothetical protein
MQQSNDSFDISEEDKSKIMKLSSNPDKLDKTFKILESQDIVC